MNRTHSLVAQIFNLPYQRRNESSRAPQSATLRNSRLKICATIYRPAQAISECAFTFVELLVVLAVVAALAATLLPVMAKSRPNSLAFQCLNNNRQLCAAWSMYAGDNRDRIVYSAYDTSSGTPAGQATWSLDFMDFDPINRCNWDTNVDIVKRPLWPYTRRDASIYKCPSDQSFVTISGIRKPRVRSMAMNAFLGVGGGTYNYSPYNQYRVFLKTTDLTSPGPAKTFVFLDMRQDSSFWTDFVLGMQGYPNNPAQYILYDLPNMIHNRGAAFSFADGRAEIHHWLDARTTPPLISGGYNTYFNSPNNQDVAWLQDHATRPK